MTLDELMETEGIVDHRGSTGLNQREYKSCFWDERHDAQRNRERVKALDRKFREKYPQIPGDIPAPLCVVDPLSPRPDVRLVDAFIIFYMCTRAARRKWRCTAAAAPGTAR